MTDQLSRALKKRSDGGIRPAVGAYSSVAFNTRDSIAYRLSFAKLSRFLPLFLLSTCVTLAASDKVPVTLPNGLTLPAEVIKVTRDEITLRVDDKQQVLKTDKMKPDEVARCYKQVRNEKDAALRFDMGKYFFEKKLFSEAEAELNGAIAANSAFKTKAEPMLTAIGALKELADGGPNKKDKSGKYSPDEESSDDPRSMEDFAKKFSRREVPARSDAEMKKFIDDRMKQLGEIGGTWRMIETKHFYCFSNIKEPKHKTMAQENESFYNKLCDVLKHKEGDKLWNNKLPIYYFESFGQFQKFAAEIDESPGAAYSGGYFSANGRDVHICIPFMTGRAGIVEKDANRLALNTLHHEGTHAFLQLTGEDVPLSRWLHEGMAQFIEFWYDNEGGEVTTRGKNAERKRNADYLANCTQRGQIPEWSEMKMRPMSGMDHMGYAWAWAKLEFFYRNFTPDCLPKMVKLIKSGKTEDEAIAGAFGHPPEQLESGFKIWVKQMGKHAFRFDAR